EAARLQHAALDVLGARAQVAVAGVDVAPGVDDADHRLAGPVGRVEAHLAPPRAVAERAQVVDAEPAIAAQWLRFAHASTPPPQRFLRQRTAPNQRCQRPNGEPDKDGSVTATRDGETRAGPRAAPSRAGSRTTARLA